jgi:arylsulfatase A-like enzyme
VADDWGYTDIGSFGSEIRTPNIDALAAHGVRFANFHVAGSCAPTRAMLQTGVSSHRAGLGNMPETIPPEHIGKPGYNTVLNHHVVTLAEVLHQAGYRTYLTGKWHLGKASDGLPTARGYDHAFSLADAGADNFEQKPIAGLYDKAVLFLDLHRRYDAALHRCRAGIGQAVLRLGQFPGQPHSGASARRVHRALCPCL